MSWNHRIVHKIIVALFILLGFYLIGCSTYSLPKESKVIVPKEELSTYNPKNFSNNNAKKQAKLQNEDQLIIQAIFLEEQGAYAQSNEFYALLYKVTQQEEYLLKEINTAYQAGILSPNLDALKDYSERNPENLQAQRLLLSFYLKKKEFNKAKQVGNKLTKISDQPIDFELAANPYIFTAEYESSLKYLKEAYEKTRNEDILLKIVTIQINYLREIDEATDLLESHREKEGCSEKICLQLIGIYAGQQKTSKIIPIYEALHQQTNKEIYAEKVVEGHLLNQDIDSAIKYLEQDQINHTLLYSLYMEKKSYAKANQLTNQLIKKTNEPKWYAESAISYYESLSNKNDRAELQKVASQFEKAFELGEQSPVYLNYYGYTLIEKELDIEKGLIFIKKALAEEPDNTYFLDSLAWGYYKLNNCERAYPIMKKVVEVEGLNEEEIIEHWNAIHNKCKSE